MKSLLEKENREKESWVQTALGNIHHPLRQESATKHLKDILEALEAVQLTGDIFFPGRWLDAVVGRYSSPTAAQAVRDYMKQTPKLSPRLLQKLLQSADVLLRINPMEESSN